MHWLNLICRDCKQHHFCKPHRECYWCGGRLVVPSVDQVEPVEERKPDMGLVLTRKIGEAIVIDESTTVRIVELGPGKVKLEIDAPPEVRVHREEVQIRIEAMRGIA